MVEAFVDAYFAIDTKMRGLITSAQLSRYMKQHNYTDEFASKWLRLFDPGDTGLITLEQYCSTLGLDANGVRKSRSTAVSTTAAATASTAPAVVSSAVAATSVQEADLPADVTAISSDMTLDEQLKIVRIVRESLRLHSHQKDVAKYVKHQCDSQLGRMWHALVVSGQFWCWYSHEPGQSFIFRLGKLIYCVWRSPGY